MRDEIVRHVGRLGLTRYEVVKLAGKTLSPTAVYDYLAGRRDMKTASAAKLLKAVGLEIRPKEAKDV